MIFNHMIHSPCYKGVMLYTVCLHSITIIIIMTRLMTTLLVTLAQAAVSPGQHKDESLFNKIVFCKQ